MYLINITVIFPPCLLSVMKNIKKDFSYSVRQVGRTFKEKSTTFSSAKDL